MDRNIPVAIITSWLGRKESDGSHKEIIDIYNTISPRPSGYKMKYTDSWCAATVSAAYHTAGYDSIFPSECSCGRMIKKAKAAGIWMENDSYVPSPADCVLYDWQDDGVGDNVGVPDHVGMVVSVGGGEMVIIEGNYSDSVKVRHLKINGKYIRGFVTPKFTDEPAPTKKSNEQVAKEVYEGKWGNGQVRKNKLEAAGYKYSEIQALVNQMIL